MQRGIPGVEMTWFGLRFKDRKRGRGYVGESYWEVLKMGDVLFLVVNLFHEEKN